MRAFTRVLKTTHQYYRSFLQTQKSSRSAKWWADGYQGASWLLQRSCKYQRYLRQWSRAGTLLPGCRWLMTDRCEKQIRSNRFQLILISSRRKNDALERFGTAIRQEVQKKEFADVFLWDYNVNLQYTRICGSGLPAALTARRIYSNPLAAKHIKGR